MSGQCNVWQYLPITLTFESNWLLHVGTSSSSILRRRGLYQHFPTSKDINVQVEIDAFWFLEDLITTLSHTSLTNKSKNCESAVPTNVNHIFPSFLIHSSGLRNLTGKPASCESWECKAQVSFLWKFQPGASTSSRIVQLYNTHYQWFRWKDDQRVQLMWDTFWKKIVTLLRLKTIRVWKHFMSCRCGIFEVITAHNISAYQIEARVEQTKIDALSSHYWVLWSFYHDTATFITDVTPLPNHPRDKIAHRLTCV